MNELIPVNQDSERQTVSGRLLHEFLEVETQYSIWLERMVGYGFSRGIDFEAINQKRLTAQGNETTYTDHQLTIEMAKEICMLQRTEKGKQARQYFIELEKAWNSPEMVMSRALKMADRKIASLQEERQKLLPKAESFDKFISGTNLQDMNTAAKALGWGRNKLFAELRNRKVFMASNEPYQDYIDRGYFEVKEKPINMGGQVINKPQTYVTPKGVDWLNKQLN